MRIKSIEVKPLRAVLARPFRVASGQHDSVDNVLLVLTLANGIKGFGEAAVATHITSETVPQVTKTLHEAQAWLRGKPIGAFISLCSQAREAAGSQQSALAAIEMALSDAVAKYLNIPLWKMWGMKTRRLVTDITIVIGSLDETLDAAREFYAQGFRSFKIKIGKDMDEDFKRVAGVRQIVGTSTILLDANQGFNASETIKFLRMMGRAGIDIAMIEQPVAKQDLEGLKEVSRKTKVLVCADESASSLDDAVALIQQKAVGAINIKLMKTGLTHADQIARLAQANGIKLMIGGMMETSLAMTASAHFASGLGGFDFIDLDTPFFIKDGLKGNPFLSLRGCYDLTGVKAGIGIVP